MRAAMEFREVSRHELARRTGLSYMTVKTLVDGERNGTLASWVLVAKALGMTMDQLLEGDFDGE